MNNKVCLMLQLLELYQQLDSIDEEATCTKMIVEEYVKKIEKKLLEVLKEGLKDEKR